MHIHSYIPRDSLEHSEQSLLDWTGDHVHTTFRDFFVHAVEENFHVDVLNTPFSCLYRRQENLPNLAVEQYGVLIIADPERWFSENDIASIGQVGGCITDRQGVVALQRRLAGIGGQTSHMFTRRDVVILSHSVILGRPRWDVVTRVCRLVQQEGDGRGCLL